MKNKSLKELKPIIESDIQYNKNNLEAWEGDQNPQIKIMYIQAQARIEALENVLDYIKTGSKIMFEQ